MTDAVGEFAEGPAYFRTLHSNLAQREVKPVLLKPQPISLVPEETARVARAAFPKGSAFMRMRDELGVLWEDEDKPHQ